MAHLEAVDIHLRNTLNALNNSNDEHDYVSR